MIIDDDLPVKNGDCPARKRLNYQRVNQPVYGNIMGI
jgi:hypothetical protein